MKDTPESQAFLLAVATGQNHQIEALLPAPIFTLGQIVSTPAALEAMQEANIDPLSLLRRHITGDWGDLDKDSKHLNDLAAERGGSRIFSAYNIGQKQRIWIITEADRSSTCMLKPEDY